jgi:hypothetical protein
MTTGDWDSRVSRVMGAAWRLMTPPQHLFFFSRKTIDLLLTRLGFDVVACSWPGRLVPANLVLFQVTRIARMRPRTIRALNRVGLPVNLWDALRVIAVKGGRA